MTVIHLRNRMIKYKINTKYEVNKEKRTVVCIITTKNEVPARLAKYAGGDKYFNNYMSDIRTYRGVAKCAEEDEWDEAYGCRLAEYRATRARQIDVNNELKKYINTCTKYIDNLYDNGLIKEPKKPQLRV